MSSYLREAFVELYEQDGLVVMARGLGLRRLLAKFLHLHSALEVPAAAAVATAAAGAGAAAAAAAAPRPVFCLNAGGEEDLLLDALMAEGVPPSKLPVIVTNEYTAKERGELYRRGGCFLVTSRILIVDLLNGVVDPANIGGFLVQNAHRVTDTCTEAFILRIFRQHNNHRDISGYGAGDGGNVGFVKAFSDDPEALLNGFGRIERTLRSLGVSRMYLWPRFHASVADALGRNQPEVVEMVQGLTPAMAAVQQSVVVALHSCLQELKRAAPSLDVAELTVENGLFKAFDASIRRQLDPEWHKISPRTKQLVSDLQTLRKLLDYFTRYDAVTFYSFLTLLRSNSAQMKYPSLWLSTEAADRLFFHAKERVYRVVGTEHAFEGVDGAGSGGDGGGNGGEENAGGKAAASNGGGKNGGGKDGSGGGGKSGDAGAGSPKSGKGEKAAGGDSRGGGGPRLEAVLEENPKWSLVRDVLKEIEHEHATAAFRAAAAAAAAAATSDGATEVAGGARVLIFVQDERTAAQLKEFLTLGGPAMMRRRFLRFLADANARARRAAAAWERGSGGGGRGRGGRRRRFRGGRGCGARVRDRDIAVRATVTEAGAAGSVDLAASAAAAMATAVIDEVAASSAAAVTEAAAAAAAVAEVAVTAAATAAMGTMDGGASSLSVGGAPGASNGAAGRVMATEPPAALGPNGAATSSGSTDAGWSNAAGTTNSATGAAEAAGPSASVTVVGASATAAHVASNPYAQKLAPPQQIPAFGPRPAAGAGEGVASGVARAAPARIASAAVRMAALEHRLLMDAEEHMYIELGMTVPRRVVAAAGDGVAGDGKRKASREGTTRATAGKTTMGQKRTGKGKAAAVAGNGGGGDDRGGGGRHGRAAAPKRRRVSHETGGNNRGTDEVYEIERGLEARGVFDPLLPDSDDAGPSSDAEMADIVDRDDGGAGGDDISGGGGSRGDDAGGESGAAVVAKAAENGKSDAGSGSGAVRGRGGDGGSGGKHAEETESEHDAEVVEDASADVFDPPDVQTPADAAAAAMTAVAEAERKKSALADWGEVPGGRGGCGRSSGGGGSTAAVWRCAPLPSLHVALLTYAQASESLSILDDLEPDYVIMYDPSLEMIRELEVHQAWRRCRRRDNATAGGGASSGGAGCDDGDGGNGSGGGGQGGGGRGGCGLRRLRVYFLLYEDSVEESRYLTALDREKRAFESLIEQKSHMILPLVTIEAPPPGFGSTGSRNGYGAGGYGVGDWSEDMRSGGVPGRRRAARAPGLAVVDVREFRSALPSLLHQAGVRLSPVTLTVGDYVLTHELCVERKSVSDLFSSFASGRLYNQVEAMSRYYKAPALLIEFAEGKAFCLQTPGELGAEIRSIDVCSKLALLLLHFPQLRILWSRSPHATVDVFRDLKKNQPDADVGKAVAVGGVGGGGADSNAADGNTALLGAGDDDGGTAGGGGIGGASAAQELLLRLPGVTVHNFRTVMRAAESVAALAAMTYNELVPLLGTAGAKRLYDFFQKQPAM